MFGVYRLVFFIVCLVVTLTKGWGQDLVVFTSKDTALSVVKDFNETVLPQLAEVSKNTGSNLRVIFVENGIPEEVKFIPAIYYVNESKSVYKSAYGSTQRIKSFILQSKVFGSNYQSFTKKKLFCSNVNGFEQGINLKVTPLTGSAEISSDSLVYDEILKGLGMNMSIFHFEETHTFSGVNKQFFLNIYPFLSAKGEYYLSYEVFSQNNCHVAILSSQNKPVAGKTIEEAARKLAIRIGESWERILGDTIHQDGIVVLDGTHHVKTWEVLGYDFGEKTKSFNKVGLGLAKGSFALEKERLIVFTFAPPADAYSGLISNVDGEFKFASGKLSGEFIVDLKSLDTGDEDLNSSILNDQFDVSQNPFAKIIFDTPIEEIRYNEILLIPAQLLFIGRELEVQLETTFSPADNRINFWVDTDFVLNISAFESLERPHYGSPINEEVHVHVAFKAHNLVD